MCKEKAKVRKRRVRQEKSGKTLRRTSYGYPKIKKNFPKSEKVKKGTSVLNTSSKRRFDRTVFWKKKKIRPSSTDWASKLQWTITLIPKIVPTRARGKNIWKYFEIEEFTLLGHLFQFLKALYFKMGEMETKELMKSSKGWLMAVSNLWEAKIQNILQYLKQTKQNKTNK